MTAKENRMTGLPLSRGGCHSCLLGVPMHFLQASLPSKDGSRTLGGLIKILFLCYKVCHRRLLTVPNSSFFKAQWWGERGGRGGDASHTRQVAQGLTSQYSLCTVGFEKEEMSPREGEPQPLWRRQTAWIQTEAVRHGINISCVDQCVWYPQMKFGY